MPELPDVEVFRRYIDSTSLHKELIGVDVEDDRLLDESTTVKDLEKLEGSEFMETKRIGKHCLIKTGKRWLALHFGMTGLVEYHKRGEPEHVKVRFRFPDGYELNYICTRVLGKLTITDDPGIYAENNDLGPDIYDMEKEEFVKRLSSKRGQIKSALMDQSLMSGLGNIYTDEVLFHASIHPKTRVSELNEEDLEGIHDIVREVIETTVKAGADPGKMPDDYLIPLMGKEDRCPLDGGKIENIKVNGRTTYFCSKHQSS